MPDTPDAPSGYENQTQPNTDGSAMPAGEPSLSQQEPPVREDRTFATRPSDTEASHGVDGGHSFRSQHQGAIGGDMGRDESKGSGQGETADAQASEGQSAPEGLPPNSPGGQMEHQDPVHAEDLQKTIDQRTGGGSGDDLGGRKDDVYDPDQVEVNHTRQQGGGMGARDLQRQGDPTRGDTSDQYGEGGGEDDQA